MKSDSSTPTSAADVGAARRPADLTTLMSGLGLQIVHRSLDELVPFARNARTHSPEQIALIAGSIRTFGFTNPILVDGTSGIIAGHGRVMAARKLGLATVPVIELAHLSERDKRALIIADNVVRDGAVIDADSRDASVQGVRRFNAALAAEPRVSATAIQTVGSKGYDGLAIAVVLS